MRSREQLDLWVCPVALFLCCSQLSTTHTRAHAHTLRANKIFFYQFNLFEKKSSHFPHSI